MCEECVGKSVFSPPIAPENPVRLAPRRLKSAAPPATPVLVAVLEVAGVAVWAVSRDGPGHGNKFIFLQGSYCNHEIHVLKSRRSPCRNLLPPFGAWARDESSKRQAFRAIY
jgi:hypothetical protein